MKTPVLRLSLFALVCALLGARPIFAQPSVTPTTVPLTVNKTTGAITGPVAASAVASSNGFAFLTGANVFTSGSSVTIGGTLNGSGAFDFSGGTVTLPAAIRVPSAVSNSGKALVSNGSIWEASTLGAGDVTSAQLSGYFADPSTAPGFAASAWRSDLGLGIGTNVAPATSGTSILYGNGSGGFSNATVGGNLTFSGGTLNLSTTPNIGVATATSVTAPTATALALSGGSSGASVTLSAGTNGGVVIDANGTGDIAISGDTGNFTSNRPLVLSAANQDVSSSLAAVSIYSTSAVSANFGGSLALGGVSTGSTLTNFAALRGAKENATDGNTAGVLTFWTRANGGPLTSRMSISSSGDVSVLGNTQSTSTTTGAFTTPGGVGVGGALFTGGKINAPASTTSSAALRLPPGSAPTSPADGDMWTTTTGLFARIDGATVGPYGSGNVVGPASATDGAAVLFDGTTGKLLKGGIIPATSGGAGTVSGILKANGSGTVSAATSGSDYAPATSGSSILSGSGSGGFSNVTVGGNLSFSGGTLNLSATPNIGAATATSVTAPTATALALTAGDGGASVTLGAGSNGGVVIDANGTGDVAFTASTGNVTSNRPFVLSAANQDVSSSAAAVSIYSTSSMSADFGGSLALGGVSTGSTLTNFAAIRGAKENATDGNTAGALTLWTRANGGPLTQRVSVSSIGTVTLTAATTAGASLNIPPGTAPTSPSNGDVWTTTSGMYARINGATQGPLGMTDVWVIVCSDETTALTTGTAKRTIPAPYAATVTAVRAVLTTAQASGSIFTVDINEAGSSILSTKLTVDNTEKTSTTAATAAVISDTAIADGAEITVDIDQIGTSGAAGLKVYIYVTRS